MKKALPLLLTLLLVASQASAATFADVTLEDTAAVADKSLVLNGMGLLEATIFNIDIYVAGLYLEAKSNDPNEIIASSQQVKLIVQQFVREIGGKDLAKGFTEAFETACGGDFATIKDKVTQFAAFIESVKAGERYTYTYLPNPARIEVTFKGKSKGTIAGDDFATAFFKVFLGPKPTSVDLREGLLGKKKR